MNLVNIKIIRFALLLLPVTVYGGTVTFEGPGAHHAFIVSPSDVTLTVEATYLGGPAVYATATYTAMLVVTFTGGTGTGLYSPCFVENAVFPARTIRVWGGVQFTGGCTAGIFPFEFGVPQVQELLFGVDTGTLPIRFITHSFGMISFSGKFFVAGHPEAIATVSEVPEPSTGVSVSFCLTLAFIASRFCGRALEGIGRSLDVVSRPARRM